MMHYRLTKYQKITLGFAILLLAVAMIDGMGARPGEPGNRSEDVESSVIGLGSMLRTVSLAAEGQVLSEAMDGAYGEFVTPELLAVWKEHPARGLGRMASSPWPERIDVGTITKNFDDSYTVLGTVVEIASVNGPPVAVYPVTLVMVERDGKWLVQTATKGSYTALPERRKVSGTYVCLPHAPGYPPTKECAFGLQADDGTYYGLDFAVMPTKEVMTRLETGEDVSVEGTFVPIEYLSTDYWLKYAIQAVVRVTAVEKL